MGNSLCNDTSVQEDPRKAATTEVKLASSASGNTIKCEICGQSRSSDKIVTHLDLCHFMDLVANGDVRNMQVVCLLCGDRLEGVDKVKVHLRVRHDFADSHAKKYLSMQQTTQLQANKTIKSRVKQIQKQQVTTQSEHKSIIENEKYKVSKFSKEYTAIQFNQNKIETDLIWKPIFQEVRNAVYYNLEYESQQKTIKVISKIYSKI